MVCKKNSERNTFRARALLRATLISTLVLFFASIGFAAVLVPGPITTCGTITTAGTYYLQNDLNNLQNTCFIIQTGNVILDGNGHSISAVTPSAFSFDGINASYSVGVQIQGLNLSNFTRGMTLTNVYNSLFTNMTFTDTPIGLLSTSGYGDDFNQLVFTRNNSSGIIFADMNTSTVEDSNFIDTGYNDHALVLRSTNANTFRNILINQPAGSLNWGISLGVNIFDPSAIYYPIGNSFQNVTILNTPLWIESSATATNNSLTNTSFGTANGSVTYSQPTILPPSSTLNTDNISIDTNLANVFVTQYLVSNPTTASPTTVTLKNISGIATPAAFRNGANCGATCTTFTNLGNNAYSFISSAQGAYSIGLSSGSGTNGACGSADGKVYSYNTTNIGADTYCASTTQPSPTPTFPAPGATMNWTCTASGGGTNASCSASRATNTSPSISITAPINGSTFTPPAAFDINATANDNDNGIANVKFFMDGSTTPLATDTTLPYSTSVSGITAGNHTITATATDLNGATSTTSIYVIVANSGNIPPSISITSPANNATFTAPASITITANATDSDGTISKVDFYNGATLIGIATISPHSYTWTNVSAGSYSLTAIATDNNNATTTSSAIAITVNPAVTNTLTVSKTGSGTITGGTINCGSTCTQTVSTPTSVTLTETPTTGYTFNGWSGACSGTSATCTVTILGAVSVTANFVVVSSGSDLNVVVGTPLVFNVATAGVYVLTGHGLVATGTGANSLYVDIDSDPGSGIGTGSTGDNNRTWDINVGVTDANVSWRGINACSDTPSCAQFNPKTWTLSVGPHTLYVNLRETGTGISTVTLVNTTPLVTTTYHPADTNHDMLITFSEYLEFANCWKNPVTCVNWNGTGSGVSLSQWANAASIWKYSGQMYHYVSGTTCPPSIPSTCWVAGN